MKSESKIQQECVMWFRSNYCLTHHAPQCIIFSVPNEGKNTIEQMAKIQTGLLSGVSDIIVVLPSGVLFLECKDEKGKQKPKQLKFQNKVESLSHNYYVFRSLDEFQSIIYKYL